MQRNSPKIDIFLGNSMWALFVMVKIEMLEREG
jgi:hypothetical protein